jgi:signal peptidase I
MWSAFVALLAGVAAGALAWHEGYRAYAIRTGSMTPSYPTGALVLDRPATGRLPAVGDVVTFRTGAGLVTHRVHSVRDDAVETKGDANRTPDAAMVPVTAVTGDVVWGARHLGYVFVFFQQPTGAVSVVLVGLSIWFAWLVFFPAKDRDDVEVRRPGDVRRPRALRYS